MRGFAGETVGWKRFQVGFWGFAYVTLDVDGEMRQIGGFRGCRILEWRCELGFLP